MDNSGKTKKHLTRLPFLAASASLLFLVGAPAGFAQTAKSESAINPATRTASDSTFAKEAAQGGMAEVKLGQLAEEKGTSKQVKDFGKRMVDDHSKAGDQLKSAASGENIALPADMSASDKATYDRLSKLSGSAFDKAYAADMVKDHEKDVNAFQREADGGKDASIKMFASKTLPTLQEHLKMAREMNDATSSSKSTSTIPSHS